MSWDSDCRTAADLKMAEDRPAGPTARSSLLPSLRATVTLSTGVLLFLLPWGNPLFAQGHRQQRLKDAFSKREMNRQPRRDRGRRDPADPQVKKFRTINGSYNNLRKVDWGVAGANLWRQTVWAYSDGFEAPARIDMPSPREISNEICDQQVSLPNQAGLTDMVWQWGQFLDHDIDLTETHLPLEPFPIAVPTGDPWFDPFGLGDQEIPLFRSDYNPSSSPREQRNRITSWIDGSNVYGSDEVTAAGLRHPTRGTLRVSTSPFGHLLPVDEHGFFLAGDVRVNEQVYLTAMHTLFMREHNRICRRLLEINPDLTRDQVYLAARKRVIAIMQSITYNEFIPAILGPNALRRYRGYDPRVFPNISNSFSTAAFRFGHSMLNSTLLRLDSDLNVIPEGNLSLADAFFNPQEIRDIGIDPYLNGLAHQLAQEVDGLLVGDVRNFLFGPPGSGGFDLAALNMQRGRDHGLPGINLIRRAFGLPAHRSFVDLTDDVEIQIALFELYGDVDNADPWIAMLCERRHPGAQVGETTFHILKNQFERLRDGDRFWYQREFEGAALEVIENTRLSNVIRRNTHIRRIRRDVFKIPN